MGAVRSFSFQVAIAVLFEAVLMLTGFVAMLSLDAKRVEKERIDLFPCITLKGANEKHSICISVKKKKRKFFSLLLIFLEFFFF